MRYFESVVDLIGNTPLVKLNRVTEGIEAKVLAKVEYLNPGGSVKDRIAGSMIDAAEAAGLLKPGGTIVEPTSGNTGVGLALIAQQRGYNCVFVCPDKVSEDKINVLRAYGARVEVCPYAVEPDDPRSYYSVSTRLSQEIENAWKPDQYSNPSNPLAHYKSTGPEIWRDTDGKVTHFVAGVGTAGTIVGTSRYLKEVSNGSVKIIGADPVGSVYSGGDGRPYLVEGVGEDFWPDNYDKSAIDEIVAVSDAESFEMTLRLAREEGLLVGGSCGMAVVAALKVAKTLPKEAVVVVILPDSGRGYLGKIFNENWMDSYGFTSSSTDDAVGHVLAKKNTELPALVHVHPTDSIQAAIDIMKEFDVYQLPVLKEEPPVAAAEIVGTLYQSDLVALLEESKNAASDAVNLHMKPVLTFCGTGESVKKALKKLETSSALIILHNGRPQGILTQQDFLSYLAN
jgi:cystathionine beta-synthase